MALKLHPADQADIEKIATATHFTVHLRSGPHEKVTKRAKTLAAAIRIADKLGMTPGGRKPLIYAITPDKMTVHVPAVMIAKARQEAAAGTRKPGQASEAGKAAKRGTAPHRAAGARRTGRRAEIAENAAKGILPPVPDFSAPTHARFRKKLDEVVEMAKAGDVKGLKAFHINPVSSSPKAIARYRDLTVQALEARAGVI